MCLCSRVCEQDLQGTFIFDILYFLFYGIYISMPSFCEDENKQGREHFKWPSVILNARSQIKVWAPF